MEEHTELSKAFGRPIGVVKVKEEVDENTVSEEKPNGSTNVSSFDSLIESQYTFMIELVRIYRMISFILDHLK